jgi:hypothetical protein
MSKSRRAAFGAGMKVLMKLINLVSASCSCIQLALLLWPLFLCAHPFIWSINAPVIGMASQQTNGQMNGWFSHAYTYSASPTSI